MWVALRAIVLLALIGVGAYAYRDQVQTFALQAYREVRPCTVPIRYAVGVIDPRFRISTSSLLSAMRSAEEMWEKAAGRELFTSVEGGSALVVNLLFDERQATTQKLADLGISLEEDLGAYESTRSRYEALLAEYERDRRAFDTRVAAYERDSRAYEREVEMWNARGGAPEAEYAALESRRAALRRDESQLRTQQDLLNRSADSVNTLARRLNALARELNITVDAYNTVGQSIEGEFEEAVYESRPGGHKIDIFEFDSEARLTRVLAHEFGHALGLEHLDDPDSVMYRLNQSRNQSLTDADIGALKALCRIDAR